jgi:hypothetical protein
MESLYVMATEGVTGKKFYIGESDVENGHVFGLVNIAAFLAQSMKETIRYDACGKCLFGLFAACARVGSLYLLMRLITNNITHTSVDTSYISPHPDENSWDFVNGKYPLSNSCGQLGQSYQDYHCSPEEAHMECEVDPNMSIKAVTHAKWYGAPAPMFCGPKTMFPTVGFWDHIYECNKSWASPPETCDVYEDQKAGRYDSSGSYANTAGRTDVEGCCWWGRGVIQTSGICNFGKLNYYLGAGAENDGRPAKYPTVDFCKFDTSLCLTSSLLLLLMLILKHMICIY